MFVTVYVVDKFLLLGIMFLFGIYIIVNNCIYMFFTSKRVFLVLGCVLKLKIT